MPNTMTKWTIELSKQEYDLFRCVLKAKDLEYEPSECGDMVHISVFCTEQDTIALNKTLEVISKCVATAK